MRQFITIPHLSWSATILTLIVISCILQWTLVWTNVTEHTIFIHNKKKDFFFPTTTRSRVNKKLQNLPPALQPVTFHECCDNKKPFRSVCYTEQACRTDSYYPFTSHEEATRFAKWEPENRTLLYQSWLECQQANNQLTPSFQWCSNNNTDDYFPRGCSRFTMQGGSGPYDRLLVFPQAKLAFCGIPKAGITQWMQFARFVAGAKDYAQFPHFKQDVAYFRLDGMHPSLQHEILTSPQWIKTVLIRNPAQRFLSAYLDKILHSRDKEQVNMTFAEFVDYVSSTNVSDPKKSGLSWYTNPHWRPQAYSCGLSEFLDKFDYVGSLDHAAEFSRTVLQRVGLWEPFGKHYRVVEPSSMDKNNNNNNNNAPQQQAIIGFLQDNVDTHNHNFDSHKVMERYYTPELLQKVETAYWMDFQLHHAIQEAGGLQSGRTIASRLNPTKCNDEMKLQVK